MPAFRSVDDILDFAIARENEDYDFYTDLAERVRNPELRETVKSFAVDELQHAVRLQAIKGGEATFLQGEVGSLDIAASTTEVQPHPEMTYADLLVIAMKREKAAFGLYTNLALIARNPESRDTLLSLAREEAQHKLRLELEYDWVSS